jgi:hypothetical protein
VTGDRPAAGGPSACRVGRRVHAGRSGATTFEVTACDDAPRRRNNAWIWIKLDARERSTCRRRVRAARPPSAGLAVRDRWSPDVAVGHARPGTRRVGLHGARRNKDQRRPSESLPRALRVGVVRCLPADREPGAIWRRASGQSNATFTCTRGSPTRSHTTFTGLSTNRLAYGVFCSSPLAGICANGATRKRAWATLYGATVTLTDAVPPQILATAGDLFSGASTWRTGTASGSVTASDAGRAESVGWSPRRRCTDPGERLGRALRLHRPGAMSDRPGGPSGGSGHGLPRRRHPHRAGPRHGRHPRPRRREPDGDRPPSRCTSTTRRPEPPRSRRLRPSASASPSTSPGARRARAPARRSPPPAGSSSRRRRRTRVRRDDRHGSQRPHGPGGRHVALKVTLRDAAGDGAPASGPSPATPPESADRAPLPPGIDHAAPGTPTLPPRRSCRRERRPRCRAPRRRRSAARGWPACERCDGGPPCASRAGRLVTGRVRVSVAGRVVAVVRVRAGRPFDVRVGVPQRTTHVVVRHRTAAGHAGRAVIVRVR